MFARPLATSEIYRMRCGGFDQGDVGYVSESESVGMFGLLSISTDISTVADWEMAFVLPDTGSSSSSDIASACKRSTTSARVSFLEH